MSSKILMALFAAFVRILVVESSGGMQMRKMIEFAKPMYACDKESEENFKFNLTNLGRHKYKLEVEVFYPDCDNIALNVTSYVCDTVEETACENIMSFPLNNFCQLLKNPGEWDDYFKNAEPPYVCPLKGWYKIKIEPNESFANKISSFLGMTDEKFYGVKTDVWCKNPMKKAFCTTILYKLVHYRS